MGVLGHEKTRPPRGGGGGPGGPPPRRRAEKWSVTVSGRPCLGRMRTEEAPQPRTPEIDADAEAATVDAAVSGDIVAFAALYRRHMERVYRHCHYWTGNRADAEDLTQ